MMASTEAKASEEEQKPSFFTVSTLDLSSGAILQRNSWVQDVVSAQVLSDTEFVAFARNKKNIAGDKIIGLIQFIFFGEEVGREPKKLSKEVIEICEIRIVSLALSPEGNLICRGIAPNGMIWVNHYVISPDPVNIVCIRSEVVGRLEAKEPPNLLVVFDDKNILFANSNWDTLFLSRPKERKKLETISQGGFAPIKSLIALPNNQAIVITQWAVDFISCDKDMIRRTKSISCEELGVKNIHYGALLHSGELALNCSRENPNVNIWCNVDLAALTMSVDREFEITANLKVHTPIAMIPTANQRLLLVYPYFIAISSSDSGFESSPSCLTKLLTDRALTKDTAGIVISYLYTPGLFKPPTGLVSRSKAELDAPAVVADSGIKCSN